MRFSDLPINRPVATLMLLISLLVMGAVAIPRLPLESMPEVERPVVHVIVPFTGSHPLEGLREVIEPLEEELSAIADIRSLTAESEPGQSHLRVEFGWDANLDMKKMEVRDAVDRSRHLLPPDLGHIRVQTFTEGRMGRGSSMLRGRISAPRDLSESWDLLDRRIKRPLERIKGVARVQLDGVSPQQVRIDLDPDALRRHSIDAGDLIGALQAANQDMDLGNIRGDGLRYDVRAVGRFASLDEIRDLQIEAGDVRVRDVAEVSFKEPVLEYGRHLDGDFAIGIDVYRDATANTVATVDRVMERLDEIRADPELEGITLLVWTNEAADIRASLTSLRDAGLYGGLLAIGVLFVFLRRISTTLIVAMAIPFSLVVACGSLYLLGHTLNVITMLGLMVGVGMLVDNAVVVIENIYRRQAQGLSPREAARAGAREVSMAVLASTATTVIVWSWLLALERDQMVIYMGPVAVTISLAVACSLLISLTFIPMAACRFISTRETRPGFVIKRMVPAYRSVLRWTLQHRFLGLLALVTLAASAAIPIFAIEWTDNMSSKERDVTISYRVYDPTTKEKLEEHVNTVEAWLFARQEELGFTNVYSWYTERPYAMTLVYLPWEKASKENLQALRDRLRQDTPLLPGIKLEIADSDDVHHGRGGGGDRRFVTVALHGEDPEYLQEIATEVEADLRGLADIKEVFGPSLQGRQEARVVVDAEKAHSLGVSPQRAADVVSFIYRGRQLRRFHRSGNEMEMILGLPDDVQPGLASLADLPIPREDDTLVPLGSLAEITLSRTPHEINRQDRRTTQRVTVEFEKTITTEEGRQRIGEKLAGLELPEGYAWDWGDRGRRRDRALGVMFKGVVLSLLLVLILMAALFESIIQPVAIFITLPLAFFGAFWALWIFGHALEPVAFMGIIILIGMVVNNGIVMVDHVNSLRRKGTERVEAIIEGCGDRLRPVLMTAITTIVGLVPLALSGFTVSDIYVNSMAIVIIGGLASSTIFTLVALPLWYTTVEDLLSVVLRSLPGRLSRPVVQRPATGVLARPTPGR